MPAPSRFGDHDFLPVLPHPPRPAPLMPATLDPRDPAGEVSHEDLIHCRLLGWLALLLAAPVLLFFLSVLIRFGINLWSIARPGR